METLYTIWEKMSDVWLSILMLVNQRYDLPLTNRSPLNINKTSGFDLKTTGLVLAG